MTREDFLFACKVLGDKELPDDEKWKSIIHAKFDNGWTITEFAERLAKNRVVFVDEEVTNKAGAKSTVCGFIVFEDVTQDVAFNSCNTDKYPGMATTFIDIAILFAVGFRNGVDGLQYKTIDEVVDNYVKIV